MSKDGKRIENWFQLHMFCRGRHVPHDIMHQWDMELLKLPDRESQEKYAAEKIEYARQNYPYITADCYLAQIEQSQDWEELHSSMYVYWDDAPSLLTDAVRTGSANTVKQLALHVLFDNKKLQEELLHLAPDKNTREALLDRAGVHEEAHYRQYPFCVRANDILRRLDDNALTLITMPDDVQQVAFDRLVKRGTFGSKQKMLDRVRAIRPEERGWEPVEFALYGLGCEATDEGFVFRKLPEYWTEGEYGKNIWKSTGCTSGLIHLMAYMYDCEFQFDGLSNLFGYTGYRYLEKWP